MIVAFILVSWNHTRRAIRAQIAEQVLPLDLFAESTKSVHRVRNIAVALSASPRIAPASLLHWLKISQVLHEKVIVLTLIVTPQPRVAEKDRLRVLEHDRNLFSVEVDFGFMEEINISQLEPELLRIVQAPKNCQIFYLLGREILLLNTRYDPLALMYRYLSNVSRPIAESLRIPPGKVIEIGTTIRL
jgi:KUP system potassium uptake protein